VTESGREKGSGHCDIAAKSYCENVVRALEHKYYQEKSYSKKFESRCYTSKMVTPSGQHQVLGWFLEAYPSVFHIGTAEGGTGQFSQQFEW
jgi:hypothetical protein